MYGEGDINLLVEEEQLEGGAGFRLGRRWQIGPTKPPTSPKVPPAESTSTDADSR
jgi:hypothetical protein